jgi:raffinose/stachyose/melibiose transport system substrate-binding protein
MEEVWLNRLSTADFLKKFDETFKQEAAEGKVPAIPAR